MRNLRIILTFRRPSIVKYSYNRGQQDALSTLFRYGTLHVSDRFTVHHQESSIVFTTTAVFRTEILKIFKISSVQTGWFKKIDAVSYIYICWTIQGISVDKKNQLDVTFCILYFSSNSCSICFGQPCAHHQELTTASCYSLVLVCAVAAGRLSRPVGR